MLTDKRKTVLYSATVFVLLCLVFFIPNGSSRMYAAILLLVGGIAGFYLLKKRAIYSIESKQVLLLMTVAGILYLTLYYLSGLKFGFYRAYNAFSAKTLYQYVYPCIDCHRQRMDSQNRACARKQMGERFCLFDRGTFRSAHFCGDEEYPYV